MSMGQTRNAIDLQVWMCSGIFDELMLRHRASLGRNHLLVQYVIMTWAVKDMNDCSFRIRRLDWEVVCIDLCSLASVKVDNLDSHVNWLQKNFHKQGHANVLYFIVTRL